MTPSGVVRSWVVKAPATTLTSRATGSEEVQVRRPPSGAESAPLPPRSSFRFGHAASFAIPGSLPRLFASYHPSQQNTQTGKLTPEMMRRVFRDIRSYLES